MLPAFVEKMPASTEYFKVWCPQIVVNSREAKNTRMKTCWVVSNGRCVCQGEAWSLIALWWALCSYIINACMHKYKTSPSGLVASFSFFPFQWETSQCGRESTYLGNLSMISVYSPWVLGSLFDWICSMTRESVSKPLSPTHFGTTDTVSYPTSWLGHTLQLWHYTFWIKHVAFSSFLK